MKTSKLSLTVVVLLALAGVVYFFWLHPQSPTTPPQTETPPANPNWETYIDLDHDITFQYPTELSTTYIHAVDWPPVFAITDGPFTCTEAGLETGRAGQTKKITVNGRTYCVTKESEGAAGSTYTNYAYAFPRAVQGVDKVAIFTFSLRAVQCGNYDEPKKTECERERADFNPDALADQIAQSIKPR